MLMNDLRHYGSVARFLHWGMALLIICLLALGLYMTGLEQEHPLRHDLYDLHKATGILVLELAVLRLLWNLVNTQPAPVDNMEPWERRAAHGAHQLLYLLMFIVPLSGWAFSSFGGYDFTFYGQYEVPLLFEENKAAFETAREVHEILAFSLLGLVVLHVLAALKHHYLEQDNTLRKMTARYLHE